MARKPQSFIPPKGVNTEAPKAPEPVTITITPEQVMGIQLRQQTVNAAASDLNSFVGGVITGHGFDGVQVTGFDPAQRTLTFVKPRVDNRVEKV